MPDQYTLSPQPPPGEDTAPVPVARSPRWPTARLTLFALLVGLVCGLPHILMPMFLNAEGKHYSPLAMRAGSLTYHELTEDAPRIREVVDGHPFSAAPVTWEGKDNPPILCRDLVGSLVVGGLSMCLGRSVPNAFVACDFILPPLLFLIFVAIARRLGAPECVAIAAGVMGTLGGPLMRGMTGGDAPLPATALLTPEFNAVVTFGALLAVLALYENPRWRRAVGAAIFLGLLAYCHPLYWTFVAVSGLLLAASCVWDRAHRRSLTTLLVALALGAALGGPALWQALSLPQFVTTTALFAPNASTVLQNILEVLFFLIVWLAYPRRRPERAPVRLVSAAAFLLAMQSPHWLSLTWHPWSAFVLVFLLWRGIRAGARVLAARRRDAPNVADLPRKTDQLVNLCTLSLAGLVLLWVANAQGIYAAAAFPAHALHADVRQALGELDKRADKGSVVLGLDPEALALIPVYTGCNVLAPPQGALGVPAGEAAERAALTSAAYRANSLKALVKAARRYRADFICWGPVERRYADPAIEKRLAKHLFIDAGEVKVYRVPTTLSPAPKPERSAPAWSPPSAKSPSSPAKR